MYNMIKDLPTVERHEKLATFEEDRYERDLEEEGQSAASLEQQTNLPPTILLQLWRVEKFVGILLPLACPQVQRSILCSLCQEACALGELHFRRS